MFKLNPTEKAAFDLRRKTAKKAPIKDKMYYLMFCGKAVYENTLYSFCVAEKNRLRQSGVNVSNYHVV